MQMYGYSLQWADNTVKQAAQLDKLMRDADAFVTANTNAFATQGNGLLSSAF